MRELPVLSVLAVVALGLAVTVLVDWQPGAFLIGAGLLLAGGLRLALRERQAGHLVVRGRVGDATVLLVLGFALVALANAIPRG